MSTARTACLDSKIPELIERLSSKEWEKRRDAIIELRVRVACPAPMLVVRCWAC